MSKAKVRRANDSPSSDSRVNVGAVSTADVTEREARSEPIVHADVIARRAYEKFVARGFEHGHDFEDWCAAEQELRMEREPQRYDGDAPIVIS
jgi:hypothetical protein